MARVARCGAVLAVVALGSATVHAQQAPDAPSVEDLLDKKIAVWRFDALGIENEIVQRLETLFRMELDRLDKTKQPSLKDIQRTITGNEQN